MSLFDLFSSNNDEPTPSVPEGPTCENPGNQGPEDCYGFDEPEDDDESEEDTSEDDESEEDTSEDDDGSDD